MICIKALMEESQGTDDKDKQGVIGWAARGV